MFPDPPGVFCARSRPPTGHMVNKNKILGKSKDPPNPENIPLYSALFAHFRLP